MKLSAMLRPAGALLLVFLLTLSFGCQPKAAVWEQDATTAKYTKHKRASWNSDEDSELSANQEDFQGEEQDFIPLKEEDLRGSLADAAIRQPKETPGAEGSSVPGIQQFYDPSGDVGSLFKIVHFNTNDHMLRQKEDRDNVVRMAQYLKDHPEVSLFVEGHCDERGPAAYNLSLGTRRANHVRALLIQHGADPDQIHTISYGLEKPISFGHSSEDWAQNRRAQFKIHRKTRG